MGCYGGFRGGRVVSYERGAPVVLKWCQEVPALSRRTSLLLNAKIQSSECICLVPLIQGYLADKKQPAPPRTTVGPSAWSYCRVLGVGLFLISEVPLWRSSGARRCQHSHAARHFF